ncbi:hypothetical protein BDZ94DRAFT_1276029 [Collybia nuda]|uniref:Uncharacterized protein n=1 Tax=Collybia nuda TaxID=64659 RepID=A0A9P5XT88_9AGAR|nr:hypothetical protein BDZ94DRAFT_1276029 [Collybia nuda]
MIIVFLPLSQHLPASIELALQPPHTSSPHKLHPKTSTYSVTPRVRTSFPNSNHAPSTHASPFQTPISPTKFP